MRKMIGLSFMFLVLLLLGGVAIAGGSTNDGVSGLCHSTGLFASLDANAVATPGGAIIAALRNEPGKKGGGGGYGLSLKDATDWNGIEKTDPGDYLPDISLYMLA